MAELRTNAERRALKATELPNFENVALLGLKSQVAEMLNMIGRNSEIFATYTKHDISHIEAMLEHLDWIIPPSTQSAMTPVDWLLITLSIYFHDLGLLVTTGEFLNRGSNEAFRSFLERIRTDPKSQDYLGRAKKMSPEQQERFFFQEFIREHHASRIREWITGRQSRNWGTSVKPIVEEIAKMVDPFPARFRENLATVCESHHRENLNRLDLYPLYQRYGNHPAEMANVQYAALILRTVDLIHVTKDRTPSVMYKTINLSDPKGVDEWDKQRQTFAVRHAGRAFSPVDETTHMITVSADFTEERPFFALTEYLAWADAEIRQTKRWSDQSRAEKDADSFWFPWQGIRGDLRVEGNEPQQMRFEFDRGRLLDLLVGHAIYNDATVAVRELLQNAIDAVRFQHHLDTKDAESTGRSQPSMGKVSVLWDKEARRLVVEDQGIGMDLDIIRHHLMRVGSSFYDTPQFATEHKSFTPISRFGIGVLTCFMISDDIEIVTVKGIHGHRIRMSSVHADYLLRELPLGDLKLAGIEPHGTRVTLVVREGVDLEKRGIREILHDWIVLPECRVEYSEDGNPHEKIGFDSPGEALASFYDESRRAGQGTWRGIEVISRNLDSNGGQYQMALAVKSGWLPERTFAPPPSGDIPSVCIEGIRVSTILPGFGQQQRQSQGRPVALVSVRGVRGLRTTVSRAGLEQDDEYSKLARICIDMLMDHVREEIGRISNEKGRPLSRASTAGKWLSTDLASAISDRSVYAHLYKRRSQIPFMVIERIETRNSSSIVERYLISPEDLGRLDHFWTIESRLVDSLGIISRDLGRELSLNEFLTSLAPEHAELGHSPILPDASLFIDDIWGSHRPDLVQFSRLYQQTAIRWKPGWSPEVEAWETLTRNNVFRLEIREEARRQSEGRGDAGREISLGLKTVIARIEGDEQGVTVVQTRIATLLAEDSEVARIWKLMQDGVVEGWRRREMRKVVVLMRLLALFEGILTQRGRPTSAWYDHEEAQMRSDYLWKALSEEGNSALTEYGLVGNIPGTWEFLAAAKIFDAAHYWRDWHRTERRAWEEVRF